MAQKKLSSITLSDIFDVVMTYKWRVVVVAYAVGMIVLSLSLLLPKRYVGTAQFVSTSDETLANLLDRDTPEITSLLKNTTNANLRGQNRNMIFRQAIQNVRAKAIAGEGPALKITDSEAMSLLSSGIAVSSRSRPGNDTFTVSLRGNHQDSIVVLLNEVVELHTKDIHREIREMLDKLISDFDVEFEELSLSQRQYLLEVRQLRREYPHAIPDAVDVTRKTIDRISDDIKAMQERMYRFAKDLSDKEIEKSKIGNPVPITRVRIEPNEQHGLMQDRINELEMSLNQMVAVEGLTEQHPRYISTTKLVNGLKERLKSVPQTIKITSTETVGGGSTKVVDQDIAFIKGSMDRLQKEIVEHRQKREDLQMALTQENYVLKELQNRQSKLEELAIEIKDNVQDNRTLKAIRKDGFESNRSIQIQFTSPCRAHHVKSAEYPKFTHIMTAALIIAAGFGVLVAFISDRLSNTLQSATEAKEILPVPVIGVIGEIKSLAELRWLRFKNFIFIPGLCIFMIISLTIMAGVNYSLITGVFDVQGRVKQMVEQFNGAVAHDTDQKEMRGS